MSISGQDAVNRFLENEVRLDDFLNSPTNYTDKNAALVESLPHLVANINNLTLTIVDKGAWLSSTNYNKNDVVKQNGNNYICLITHTASAFANDLSGGKWFLYLNATLSDLNALLNIIKTNSEANSVVKSKSDGTIDTDWLPSGKTTTSVFAYGDSITVGVGATVPATGGYAYVLAASMGWTMVNNAISGGSIPDWIVPCYNQDVSDDGISFVMPGFNDLAFMGPNSQYYKAYENALYAAIAHLAIPESRKIKANSSRITYTGSWSNSPVRSYGKYTTNLNDSATFYSWGSVLYISTLQYRGENGLLNINIDGIDYGTFDTCQDVQNGGAVSNRIYTPMLIRITNLGDGCHAVIAKNVGKSSMSSSAYTYIDWVAGSGPIGDTSAKVFVTNTLRENATGAAAQSVYKNATDKGSADFSRIAERVACNLASDGLQVMYIDVTSYYDPYSSDVNADNVHPSDTGHSKIASAFKAQIKRFLQPNMVTGCTNSSRLALPQTCQNYSPVMRGSSVVGAHTYTAQEGSYVISGKICTVSFRVVVATVDAAMAGATCITLPSSAPLSNNARVHTGFIGQKTGVSLSASCTGLYCETASAGDKTVVYLRQAHPTTVTDLPAGNLSNGMEIRGNISYPID